MKILFIYFRTMKVFVFAIACLAAFVKKFGFTNIKVMCITNQEFESAEYEHQFKNEIISFNPDTVCFSVMTNHWKMVKQTAQWIKDVSKAFVLCGGYHPTLFPDEVITEPAIDALNIGEGEESLLELLNNLPQGDIIHIRNMWFKKDGKIYKNDVRPLIQDLDVLPFPDRDIFEQHAINGVGKTIIEEFMPDKKVVMMNTSRGCLFSCNYCSNQAFRGLYAGFGPKHFIRKRSIGHLMEEMKILSQKHAPDFFEFQDELFPLDTDWLTQYKKAYSSIGVPFAIHMRIGTFTNDILALLREAGCFMVYIGIECGNEKFRREILNKSITNQRIRESFSVLKKLGFKTVTYNMVGLPFETKELIKETIEFNREINADYPLFFSYQPLPGTKLYDLCIEKNLIKNINTYGNYYKQEARLKLDIANDDLKRCWEEICAFQIERTGKAQGYF